ncbi:hypothetical protein ACFY4C_33675 [Actinomadura viridis]|uniref:hypothetical protein n=1 Tax=Actinomadura viridis TaxID=58110 RepID=UPI0036CD4F9C
MRLIVTVVLFALAALPAVAGTAHAAPAPGRADLLARRLASDPVQVTDHEPRALPGDTAAQIRALVGRLGVPVYVVVGPTMLPRSESAGPGELIPLLHDRLRKNGVYIVTDADGGGSARQYGGSLPVDRAWSTARFELPYDAGVIAHVRRFVEIMTAPDVARRIDERRPAPERPRRDRGAERDRKEMLAMAAGTAAGATALLVPLAVRRRRKVRR